jgi:hypothetical protein
MNEFAARFGPWKVKCGSWYSGSISVAGLSRLTPTVNRLRTDPPVRPRLHHSLGGSRRSAQPAGAGTSGKRCS